MEKQMTITPDKGWAVTKTTIENGNVVISYREPKAGDVMYSEWKVPFRDKPDWAISILEGEYMGEKESLCYHVSLGNEVGIKESNNIGTSFPRTDQPATDTQRLQLSDAMYKAGLQWSENNGRMEKIPYIPKIGEVVKSKPDGRVTFLYSGIDGAFKTGFGNLYMDGKDSIVIGGKRMCSDIDPTTHADRCEFFESLNAAGYKWNAKKLLLTKKEEKKWEPKEGDFVTCEKNTQGNMWFIIWGGKTDTDYIHEKFGYSPSGKNISVGCCCGVVDTFRPMHDSEKQVLLTVLKKEGKRWNAEKKCVENIGLNRVDRNEHYYVLDAQGIPIRICECLDEYDNRRFEFGNYFHTRTEAEEFFEKEIKPVYKKRK